MSYGEATPEAAGGITGHRGLPGPLEHQQGGLARGWPRFMIGSSTAALRGSITTGTSTPQEEGGGGEGMVCPGRGCPLRQGSRGYDQPPAGNDAAGDYGARGDGRARVARERGGRPRGGRPRGGRSGGAGAYGAGLAAAAAAAYVAGHRGAGGAARGGGRPAVGRSAAPGRPDRRCGRRGLHRDHAGGPAHPTPVGQPGGDRGQAARGAPVRARRGRGSRRGAHGGGPAPARVQPAPSGGAQHPTTGKAVDHEPAAVRVPGRGRTSR